MSILALTFGHDFFSAGPGVGRGRKHVGLESGRRVWVCVPRLLGRGGGFEKMLSSSTCKGESAFFVKGACHLQILTPSGQKPLCRHCQVAFLRAARLDL